ncbi:hypothetical protein [Kineococcus sp. SYSU DK004]|uniref:hypothetical protein n=1 Tax=Kineococcus sp. SYSU DK004 TaxID=3383125 RepID=UPI003D7C5516
MSGRWWQRSGGSAEELEGLREEVARLTQENLRLRLEQQRPAGLHHVQRQIARHAAAGGEAAERASAQHEAADEAADEAVHALAQAETARRAVLDVLDSLVVAAGQMQRQLTEGVPLAELDRRVVDRRSPGRVGDGRGAGTVPVRRLDTASR